VKKLTPILLVDSIEASLPFWVDRLGFTKVVEVPEETALGFVILASGAAEVMLQSRASMKKDIPALAASGGAGGGAGGAIVYLDVEDLSAIEGKLRGIEIVHPRRTTFYGAEELWVREPSGHVVGFAQQKRD
jgi:uncharacterized glyoxalase superfamily protein PhnB